MDEYMYSALQELFKKDHSAEELSNIINERQAWSKESYESDRHGTAREQMLTAALARQCLELLHRVT